MNKKGKEGGSTWFNRRQTEIPLFKINKKKKKADGASAGQRGPGRGPTKVPLSARARRCLGPGWGDGGSPRGAGRGEGAAGGAAHAALPSPAPPPARVHCAPVSPQPATMPRKKGAAWEEPSSGNGTARAGPRRRGGPAGRKRERPERCSSSSGGGSSGDEDGPELDGAPGGGKRAARPAAAGKAGGAAAVITEPEHTKERVVSGAGARAVGGWGEGRRGGHAPPLPPRRAGNSGELVPGRGSGACVATRGLSLCRGCVLPPPRSTPPLRVFSSGGGRATRRERPARAGALRFPPLRLGRPGGAGPGARRACSLGTRRGRPAGARGAWWGPARV